LTLGPDFPPDGSPLPAALNGPPLSGRPGLLPPQTIVCMIASSTPPTTAAPGRLPCRSQPLCLRIATSVPLPAAGALAPALGVPSASIIWTVDSQGLANVLAVRVTCPPLPPGALAAFAGGVAVEFSTSGGIFRAIPAAALRSGMAAAGPDGWSMVLAADALLGAVSAPVGEPTPVEFRVAAATGRGPRQVGLRSNRIVLIRPSSEPRPVRCVCLGLKPRMYASK
jgi:hypothetical protein